MNQIPNVKSEFDNIMKNELDTIKDSIKQEILQYI